MKLRESSKAPANADSSPSVVEEAERSRILERFGLDGLEDDPELARIAAFAAKLCDTPIALVSLVEEERQRFLVHEGLDASETPRNQSFCAHTMLRDRAMVVTDAAKDQSFADNPLVVGEPGIRFYAGQPLNSREGVPLGSLCVIDRKPRAEGLTQFQLDGLEVLAEAVMRRLAARRFSIKSTRELESSKKHLETVIDSIADIAFSADAEGHFEYFNRRWYEYTGEPDDFLFDTALVNVHPADRDEALALWSKSLADESPMETEFRYRRADGAYRWMLVRILPWRAANGALNRWFGTMTDIDASHRQSDEREVLARELSHRIKNIFAVVSGLISLRARGKPEIREFADDLKHTVLALGRAHDYVRPMEGRKGNSLRGLLEDLLAPYRDLSGDGISISGADLAIGPRAATPLALVFHELATNSAKYGALGTDDGEVSVTISPEDSDHKTIIEWRERTLIDADHAGREGFGSRLVKLAVEGQLGGSIERCFDDQGLHVVLTVSSKAIAS